VKWVSHILIAGAVCAVFNPVALPAAVAGSTAPDWFEGLARAVRQDQRVKHRAATHYLAAWAMAALFALLIWDYQRWLLWFSLGGMVHWFCDALTISGAPLGWWSDRRLTLFGGKVLTGSPTEYLITGVIVVICAAFIWAGQGVGGFIPFFYHWQNLYERGVIDAFEWRSNRFNFI
jgi:inner membrane protein